MQKFHIYDPKELQSGVFQSAWSCVPFDEKHISSKPILNNSYHPIGDLSTITTVNAESCEYFIVPYYIRHTHHMKDNDGFKEHLEQNLPYFSKYPEKHIFFVGSDDNRPIACLEKSIKFAFSTKKNTNDIPIYYQPIIPVPVKPSRIELANFDVSFQGYMCNDVRKRMAKAVLSSNLKKVVINTRYWFQKFMRHDTTVVERNYAGLIQMSKFILCPRGFGTSSVRFYETLAYGRIPILISDETKMPLEDKINYDEFVIRVRENELDSIEEKIRKCTNIIEKSQKARETWEKWFSPRKFDFFLQESLNSSCK